MMRTDGLLLDTCAIIYLSQAAALKQSAMALIERARRAEAPLCVSCMSAWEIGLLVSRDRLPAVSQPLDWFKNFVEAAGLSVLPASPEILVASSFLPELVHKDPMDRIIIATARAENLAIVTRDRTIISYGAAGHVKAVPC